MTAFLLDNGSATALTRGSLSAGSEGSHDEKWLQGLLFDHPELIPIDAFEPGADKVLKLCRELPLPRAGGSVFLDMIAVTKTGRLVLIECKLWRNPQARREVIAQIAEYAALLRKWNFTDLTERLRQREGWTGQNPIYNAAKKLWPDVSEADLVDGISRSLATGDFILLIVGDGIRSDLHAIADHLSGSGLARLGLVEIQLWNDDKGRTLVVPRVAMQTEIIKHRIILNESGLPVLFEAMPTGDEEMSRPPQTGTEAEDAAAKRAINRAFWQRFIDGVTFTHTDQPAPRHSGNNNVRLTMPAGAPWITVYRSEGIDRLGMFVTFKGERGEQAFAQLEGEADAMRAEAHLDLNFVVSSTDPFTAEINVRIKKSDYPTEEAQLKCLYDAADRFVSLLRPRLKALYGEEQP